MMVYRGYNESADPKIGDIISRAITYTKKLILCYYSSLGDFSQEIRVFLDNEQGNKINELNYVLEFFENKGNLLQVISKEDFKFVDDRILGAVKVYGKHLKTERKDLVLDLEELDEEILKIDETLEKESKDFGNYDLYTKLYDELSQKKKINISSQDF